MVKQTVKVLDDAGVDPKDRKDVLILASLVEAEAKLDEDRPKIARVFLNRLETDGEPTYGLLQSDGGLLRGPAPRRCSRPRPSSEDASNPYNTRLISGLPISNPGAASIYGRRQPGRRALVLLRRGRPDHGVDWYAVTLDEQRQRS